MFIINFLKDFTHDDKWELDKKNKVYVLKQKRTIQKRKRRMIKGIRICSKI
jgi:hypothetical protein